MINKKKGKDKNKPREYNNNNNTINKEFSLEENTQ